MILSYFFLNPGARVLSIRHLFELITDPNLDAKNVDVPEYISTHYDETAAANEQVLATFE